MAKLYQCEQRMYPRDYLPDCITHVSVTQNEALLYRVRFHSFYGYTISPKSSNTGSPYLTLFEACEYAARAKAHNMNVQWS